MTQVIQYLAILKLKALAYLPFGILYRISDFLFFLLYRVLKYRYAVVMENLRNSFPEKPEKELKQIAYGFYSHLCDLLVEVPKMGTISEEQALKRLRYTNVDYLEKLASEKKHALVVFGHYNNWEWGGFSPLFCNKFQHLAIYKPLTSKVFDAYLFKIRQRFGVKPVAMHHIFREIFKHNNQGMLTATAFVADQAPTFGESQNWLPFLNQQTAVFTGVERIARKIDSVVLFADVKKVKRGHYEIELIPICENPKDVDELEITRLHLNYLEKVIRRQPEFWLWSHRRWKRQPNKN